MNEFLHMGGYAVYVWSAFGLTFIVLLANFVVVRQGLAKTKTRILDRNTTEQGK